MLITNAIGIPPAAHLSPALTQPQCGHPDVALPNRSPNRQVLLMDKARRSASFDSRRLTYVLYGGERAVRLREEILARVEATLGETDAMKLPRQYGELNRTGLYYEGLTFGKAIFDEEVQRRHGLFNRSTHHHALINASPFGLHPSMFMQTIKLQASPEQLAYWLPLAESGKIIGTYCQTELGHGTFVRGLETTATFDPARDEFIIHSPTIASTKYWPGGLGFSSSHAIVMARLFIGDKDFGVHPFMTQIRSLDDFKPLPGIELGDIGLKLGLNSTDNGYAVFNHVHIPREHMMMRHAQVLRDGTYVKAPRSKLAYGTMVHSRNCIVGVVGFQLAQAATIAIRYSSVREQGLIGSGPSQEVTIMTYRSQQYRLLSIMSCAFAIVLASKTCDVIYQDLISRQTHGDHSTLPFVHMHIACMKAYATQTASDGAEDARKCCGGHGYSLLSGLPDIVSVIVPTATLEGDNYVMYQQAARYLVKAAASIRSGQSVDPQMSYLADGYLESRPQRDRCSARGVDFLNPDIQISIFQHRAVRLIFESEELLRDTQARDGVSDEEARNMHAMVLISAARAHAELFILQSFVSEVALVKDPAIRKVLKHLCDLFALVKVESPLSIGAIGFFEDGYISIEQLRTIRNHVNATLSTLLPEAVALTDAWNFSDASLALAIGQKDGNVYETLLSWTRQIPLNQEAARNGGVDRVGYEQYVRPILQAKL